MKNLLAALVTVFAALMAMAPPGHVFAAPPTQVIYSAIPVPLPGNVPSLGFDCCQTAEFGNHVQFVPGTGRNLATVTVVLSSQRCQNGQSPPGGICTTTPGATFSEPVTINLYNVAGAVGAPALGPLIATKAITFNIPFRPSEDDVHCTGGSLGRWFSTTDNACYPGLAIPETFDFTGQGIVLPEQVIWGVAYNTSNYGYHPYGTATACYTSAAGCGYDSLNVGADTFPNLIGSDPEPGTAFWNTSRQSNYCDGNPPVGVFRWDGPTMCWTANRPMASITAVAPSLSIVKMHVGSFAQGQIGATYTITVSNAIGAVPTSGTVSVNELPPSGLTITGMSGVGWTCVTVLSCNRSDPLAPGTSYPPITVTVNVAANAPVGPNAIINSATVSGGGSANSTTNDPTTITGGAVIGAASNQPTDENKYCTNTATNNTLTQVIGASSQNLSISGPAKNFTLPLFGGASTCLIQLDKGVTGGVANPCTAANPCSDGYVVVTLTTLGSGAAISCASNGLPAGQVFPALSGFASVGGGDSCQQQSLSTQLNIPCGVTAGTAAASTQVSATCTGVLFDIQSTLGACINSPTTACPSVGGNFLSGFNGGIATVTVEFLATPANGGTVGGIQLGTNNFTFQAPGIGTLLVTATPQLIPSNGTLASVVTATFACGTGFNLINGFPLSSSGFLAATNLTGSTLQPILSPGPNSGLSSVCGDGLPGTFNFTTPGNILFDNGRSAEAVSCGLNGQQNIFGGNNFFNPTGFSQTAPLVFTCSGAAVLAIGAGAAGDAPINVTYTSSVGGLTAIGSTLITVSPSGVPRISVACNPSTIAAGNTGSLCTATVTDQNGIPLTGVTGATVTFTVSDTSVATILPCQVQIAGGINITTSPNVIPQVVPNLPCLTPSGTIPGQENTFINGQATALLVASNYAHPETVTVTASLGVLIPPQFSCLVSPYTPTNYGPLSGINGYTYGGGIFSGNSIPSSTGFPSVSGCGVGNAVGFTGLASGFSTAGSGGLTGIVTLPNTTSASTTVNIGGVAGILIAGATTTSPLQGARGCNQIIVTSTTGTPLANIAALVSPTSAVVSIWRFNNGTKQFQAGFFSDPAAPTDFATTGSTAGGTLSTGFVNNPASVGPQITESYFVCINQSATIVSG